MLSEKKVTGFMKISDLKSIRNKKYSTKDLHKIPENCLWIHKHFRCFTGYLLIGYFYTQQYFGL
jgi:hypothetical protein